MQFVLCGSGFCWFANAHLPVHFVSFGFANKSMPSDCETFKLYKCNMWMRDRSEREYVFSIPISNQKKWSKQMICKIIMCLCDQRAFWPFWPCRSLSSYLFVRLRIVVVRVSTFVVVVVVNIAYLDADDHWFIWADRETLRHCVDVWMWHVIAWKTGICWTCTKSVWIRYLMPSDNFFRLLIKWIKHNCNWICC